MKRRGEKIYQPAEIWPILSKRLICLNKRWKLMTTLFVTKCSLCNYDASVLGFGFVALSSQKLWCITPGCLAITFNEGRFAYLVKQSVTLSLFTSQAFTGSIICSIKTCFHKWNCKHKSCRGVSENDTLVAYDAGRDCAGFWHRADILIPTNHHPKV